MTKLHRFRSFSQLGKRTLASSTRVAGAGARLELGEANALLLCVTGGALAVCLAPTTGSNAPRARIKAIRGDLIPVTVSSHPLGRHFSQQNLTIEPEL